MKESERLQRAVELTLSAGYQLDKEAFDFLTIIAVAEDPSELMNRALQKIEAVKDKPLFIGRQFLESVMKPPGISADFASPGERKIVPPSQPPMVEGKKTFRPFAKEVDADIAIVEDPGSNLKSSGTIEDYLEYFRDRFKRTEKLLRQRIDTKSAASVMDAIRAPANTRLKIIGMLTEKREAKQKTLLNVEDLHASTLVLIPQNAPEDLLKKVRSLLLDQVVCLAVLKTRSRLLIAEDIILPDVAQKPQRRASVPVCAALTSDMHVGSTQFQREAFNRFILWLNGKYGTEEQREIASHVKYVLVAGDIVDGIGVYPNQIKELAVKDIRDQYKLAARYIEQIPDYIEVVIIPGNHDAPRKALPQPAISRAYLETLQESRRIHSLGNPSMVKLHGVEVLLYHGRSLDDITSAVPGMEADHPEKAMKLLLQSRHLAPVYGGKTPLSPENRDPLVIERVPDIFHAGHIHALGHTNYRGVLVVNSGAWQEQTDYMRRLAFIPTPGKVPVVDLQTMEVTIVPFNQ